MGREKIVYKNKDKNVTLTLIEDEPPYMLEGNFGDKEVKMELMEGDVLPVQFENYFNTNDFCIFFIDFMYYDKNWYKLEESSPYTRVVCLLRDNEPNDTPFEYGNDYLLQKVIHKKQMRKYFGNKYTLICPRSSNVNDIADFSPKGIVFSHVIPEKIDFSKLKEAKRFKTMTGTEVEFNPKKNTIQNMETKKLDEKENSIIYVVDYYLPVVESKDNIDYWDKLLNQLLDDYLLNKIQNMTFHLNTILGYLKSPEKHKLFPIALMEPETSNLLRYFFIQKK